MSQSKLTEKDIFVKFYVEGVRSGLIANLGPERTQTLLVLATFMNEDRECWPTQGTIAECLGITREAANVRIKKLCTYRWNGRPLVTKRKVKSKNGWENIVYTTLPESYFAIFNGGESERKAEVPDVDF